MEELQVSTLIGTMYANATTKESYLALDEKARSELRYDLLNSSALARISREKVVRTLNYGMLHLALEANDYVPTGDEFLDTLFTVYYGAPISSRFSDFAMFALLIVQHCTHLDAHEWKQLHALICDFRLLITPRDTVFTSLQTWLATVHAKDLYASLFREAPSAPLKAVRRSKFVTLGMFKYTLQTPTTMLGAKAVDEYPVWLSDVIFTPRIEEQYPTLTSKISVLRDAVAGNSVFLVRCLQRQLVNVEVIVAPLGVDYDSVNEWDVTWEPMLQLLHQSKSTQGFITEPLLRAIDRCMPRFLPHVLGTIVRPPLSDDFYTRYSVPNLKQPVGTWTLGQLNAFYASYAVLPQDQLDQLHVMVHMLPRITCFVLNTPSGALGYLPFHYNQFVVQLRFEAEGSLAEILRKTEEIPHVVNVAQVPWVKDFIVMTADASTFRAVLSSPAERYWRSLHYHLCLTT
jgi:hypothetical protein